MKKTLLKTNFLLLYLFIFVSAYGANSSFDVIEVEYVAIGKRVLLGGSVVPSVEVKLKAQSSGDVIKIRAKSGDFFKKGSQIASLERESITAQKDSAKAEIESAKEVLRNAGVQYSKSIISPRYEGNNMLGGMPGMFGVFTDPMRSMFDVGSPGFEKYAIRANFYSQYAKANNKLKQARLKLKEINEKLEDTLIIAPFDGVVVKKLVNEGDVVQKGQVLLLFSNIKNLEVEAFVPARMLYSIKKGSNYRIKIDVSNYVVNTTLKQIYPVADNKTHTVKVKFSLPDNIPVIAGSYAEIELFDIFNTKKTALIPDSALVWRSSIPSVFIVNKENKTELRFVRIGDKVANDKISILSGLKKYDKVIINPGALMVSGMSI